MHGTDHETTPQGGMQHGRDKGQGGRGWGVERKAIAPGVVHTACESELLCSLWRLLQPAQVNDGAPH